MTALSAFYRLLRRRIAHRVAGPRPRGRGPAARLLRRFSPLFVAVGLVTLAVGFATDMLSMREKICSFPLLQPRLGDACGWAGVPGFPTREERTAWAAIPAGDCQAVRAFIDRFPTGVRSGDARQLLQSASAERSSRFTPTSKAEMGYVRQSATPFASEAAARSDAEARAEQDARTILCRPLDANERLVDVEVTPVTFTCLPGLSGGRACSLDYRAVCRMEQRQLLVRCG